MGKKNTRFLFLFLKKEILPSFIFNIWFFGLTTIMGLAAVPVRLFARHLSYAYARTWIRLVLWGARVLCGIRIQVSGAEYLPLDGAAIIASEHQSAFDTLVWLTLVPRASYVMKRELTRVPLFGPMLIPAGMIPVDRGGGAQALRALLQAASAARAAGRQIVIFPQGTRVAPGADVKLQPGIAAVARHLALPVIPVATDSGLCWGRRAFMKRAGTIHIALGPPVPAGTGRDALLDTIQAHWRYALLRDFGPVDKSVEDRAAAQPGDGQGGPSRLLK